MRFYCTLCNIFTYYHIRRFLSLQTLQQMNSISNISEMLKDPDFQARFEDNVSGTARRNNSFIAYVDKQGRMVREYPATSEIFQTSSDRKTMTLLSVDGVEVATGSPLVVETTPYRIPETVLAAH